MKITKQIALLSLIAFTLHFIWENAQAPLFAGYSSFGRHLPICFVGTIGDVVFTVVVYLGVGLLKNDFNWIVRLNKKDVVVLVIVGLLFATGIEQHALLISKWNYAPAMPIIPWLDVGLIPVLQMTLLLPLSFYLAREIHVRLPR